MHDNDARVLFSVVLLLVCAATFIWSLQLRFKRRALLHQERLVALEKGMDLPALTDVGERPHAPWSPRAYLLRGLMWALSGSALTIFLLGLALSTRGLESPEERIWRMQHMRTSGAASEDQLKALMTEAPRARHGMPAAVALFGLIPIAVGAAYLVVYNAEKKPPAA